MAVQQTGSLRIRRRAAGGAVGAPTALLTAEPAYNEADDTLYIGFGDDGSGNATSVRPLAGAGLFATKQNLADALAGAGAGSVTSVGLSAPAGFSVSGSPVTGTGTLTFVWSAGYRAYTDAEATKLSGVATGANNYVHPTADGSRHVPATAVGDVSKFLRSGATAGSAPTWSVLAKADVGLGNVDNTSDANKPVSTAAQSALDAKAPLASPALTGTPTAPTATQATNNAQIATTAFVKAAIATLTQSAPALLDTFDEIAAALGDDPNFAATMTTLLSEKMVKANNLSDLPNTATARTNLGLGSMATQPANNVNITGGTIDGVVFNGGTF